MNRSSNVFAPFLVAAALPFSALGAPDTTPIESDVVRVAALAAQNQQERCGGSTRLTGLQRRILDHASKGLDELRRYVWITRSIYQLDMVDTVAWIDRLGVADTDCAVAGIATR